jgi:hypothetical protein
LKQITLRGIPRELEQRLRREASKKGISMNKAFLSLLQESTGPGSKARKSVRKKILHHDLDYLAGKWTKADAESFNKALGCQRKIDEDLWSTME